MTETAAKKPAELVQHHEIGELGHFLRAFGKNKEDVVKSLLASSLQIIGLDDVKSRYAEFWEKIEKRVDSAVEAFFTKKLSKHDYFVRMDENRFALLFANSTYEEGLERANKLAGELLQLLFGELPEKNIVRVETIVLDINLVDHINDFQNMEELVEYLNTAIIEIKSPVDDEFESIEESLSVTFRPMLNNAKSFLSVNEVLPCHLENSRKQPLEISESVFGASARMRAELDYRLVQDVKPAFNKLGGLRCKPLLLISVDYETLANPYRRYEYARFLKKLPDYTKKRLIINISNVPESLLNSRIRQILSTINPLVLGFVFEVAAGWNDFDVIKDLPVYGIGFVGEDEGDLVWIEELITRTKEVELKAFWRNVGSDDLARWAFSIGIDYISGPVIGREQDQPIPPFSLKR
jgi:hypothetical protein